MTGIERIAAERQRQIDSEGYTPEHDDKHSRGELATVAETYLWFATNQADGISIQESMDAFDLDDDTYPWDKKSFKPSEDPIRNLEKAGALIAAEIDRLQRLQGA